MTRMELEQVLRATGCLRECDSRLLLCDPRWTAEQQARVETDCRAAAAPPGAGSDLGWLCIPTGGTSGTLRLARHDEQTLSAAVQGFRAHFGLARVNAVDVLPPFHVSGLMARVRCATTGGRHLAWEWKQLERGENPNLAGDNWVVSLVPTQLQRLLAAPASADWLRRFAIVFLGGGAAWPALTDAAAATGIRLSLCYGMTETAAMVAAQQPDAFLAGDRSCGRAMPHALVTLSSDGIIQIQGESVFRGYAPHFSNERHFETADAGDIDPHGGLRVVGRRDAVINTGGEKVNPAEVEAALRDLDVFADVAVIGLPDPEWGQVVVACFPLRSTAPGGNESVTHCVTLSSAARGAGAVDEALLKEVRERVAAQLPGYKRPKRYLALPAWPRNAQGKLDRRELLALATAAAPTR